MAWALNAAKDDASAAQANEKLNVLDIGLFPLCLLTNIRPRLSSPETIADGAAAWKPQPSVQLSARASAHGCKS
jgi:hypothetical protein